MNRYAAGARAERMVRKRLESAGAIVMRSAGSKGEADLAAFYPDVTWCIQVKRAKPTAAEVEAVRMVSAKTEARWAIVHYNGGLISTETFRKGKPVRTINPPGLEEQCLSASNVKRPSVN